MKTSHRVAIMVTSQIVMDIEAENDLESIRKTAYSDFLNKKGNPEVGLTMPLSVVLYPMLEEGQEPPKGSLYPAPTELPFQEGDIKNEDMELFQKFLFPVV